MHKRFVVAGGGHVIHGNRGVSSTGSQVVGVETGDLVVLACCNVSVPLACTDGGALLVDVGGLQEEELKVALKKRCPAPTYDPVTAEWVTRPPAPAKKPPRVADDDADGLMAIRVASESALAAYEDRLPQSWVRYPEAYEPSLADEEFVLFDKVASVAKRGHLASAVAGARLALQGAMEERHREFVKANSQRGTDRIRQWRRKATEALQAADALERRLFSVYHMAKRETREKEVRKKAADAGCCAGLVGEDLPPAAVKGAADGLGKGAVGKLQAPVATVAPSQAAAAETAHETFARHGLEFARPHAIARAVLGAGMSAALLGGADSVRTNLRRVEEDMRIHPSKDRRFEEEVIAPALRDAAIAATTAGGVAWGMAELTSSQPLQTGCLSGVCKHVGPAASGAFALCGVVSALQAWSRGRCTAAELKKNLARIVWGIGCGVGTTVAASAVGAGAAAAVTAGSVVSDLTGTTDAALDTLFGENLNTLRARAITYLATVLDSSPCSTDESVKQRYTELSDLISPDQPWGGCPGDAAMLNRACVELLLLRDDEQWATVQHLLTPHSVPPCPPPTTSMTLHPAADRLT
eukprot:Sspe_Gene.13753::Locus_4723_Transcript_1_1_Confidence_1.000_Length_1869::g.13753::m.13753